MAQREGKLTRDVEAAFLCMDTSLRRGGVIGRGVAARWNARARADQAEQAKWGDVHTLQVACAIERS